MHRYTALQNIRDASPRMSMLTFLLLWTSGTDLYIYVHMASWTGEV